MSTPKKIYIAGPAVFHRDHGEAFYNKVRTLLRGNGVVPLVPVDNVATGALNIRNKNIDMIKECDAIIADLSPFRSLEPDCGTAFEVGYGAALGNFDLPFNLMLADGTPVFGSFEAAFEHFLQHHAAT